MKVVQTKHLHFLAPAEKLPKNDIYIYTPGTCLSSILGFEPSKRRPFPFKTRVIWVPGIYIYIYMKPPAKTYSSPNCFGSLLQGFGGSTNPWLKPPPTWRMILVGGCRWLITIINKSPSWGYSLSKWPFHGADKMGWSSNQYFPGKQVASNSHQFEISKKKIYIYILWNHPAEFSGEKFFSSSSKSSLHPHVRTSLMSKWCWISAS